MFAAVVETFTNSTSSGEFGFTSVMSTVASFVTGLIVTLPLKPEAMLSH